MKTILKDCPTFTEENNFPQKKESQIRGSFFKLIFPTIVDTFP